MIDTGSMCVEFSQPSRFETIRKTPFLTLFISNFKLNPKYLESVKSSGSEGSIAISVMLETLFVRSNGEVLHPIHQGVVEGVGGGDAHLVWWPGTMSLDISPWRKSNSSLCFYIVILCHYDCVSLDFSILITEVVLSVSDGDGVHWPGHLRGENILNWNGRCQDWHPSRFSFLGSKSDLGLRLDLERVFFSWCEASDGPLGFSWTKFSWTNLSERSVGCGCDTPNYCEPCNDTIGLKSAWQLPTKCDKTWSDINDLKTCQWSWNTFSSCKKCRNRCWPLGWAMVCTSLKRIN